MEFKLVPKGDVWKRRGRPGRVIPPEVMELADRTYNTGKVGQVRIEAHEQEEAKELIFMLRAYAKTKGRHVRIQEVDDFLLFEFVDSARKAA